MGRALLDLPDLGAGGGLSLQELIPVDCDAINAVDRIARVERDACGTNAATRPRLIRAAPWVDDLATKWACSAPQARRTVLPLTLKSCAMLAMGRSSSSRMRRTSSF